MSPFCILEESSGLVRWAEDVKGLYNGRKIPHYLQSLTSLRNIYGTPTMKDQDMLKTLTEVSQQTILLILLNKFRTTPHTMPSKKTLLLLKAKEILMQYFVVYEKTLKMTEIDFLSNVGGLFGFCLGISIISFVEVFYWLIIRMAKNLV